MTEERNRESVRYRTIEPALSGSRDPSDPRIQRTRALLHQALGSLMREKAYDRITVADILERARISRSTFYVHFRDKDDLLASSMRALLLGALPVGGRAATDIADGMLAFSLPLLTHIHQHQRSAKVRLGDRGRAVLHEHLRRVLAEWIVQSLDEHLRRGRSRRSPIVPALLARHIASTFVLVLHWWMDGGAASPAEADESFRALVTPLLRSTQP